MLACSLRFIFGQQTTPKKVLVIYVGHGGKDTGAFGINEIMEKNVELQLANEIFRLNKNQGNLDIYLTRFRHPCFFN